MSKLKNTAERIHTHTVTFADSSDEEDCAVRAMIGQSSKAIGRERGLTVGQVQYRIKKGGLVGERGKYRNGKTPMSELVYRLVKKHARKIVQRDIRPKFLPLEER